MFSALMRPIRRTDPLSVFKRYYSLFEGCFLVALGIWFLKAAGLMVSGTAGLSLLLMRWVPELSFGLLFFIINLPFFALALKTKPLAFALRTLLAMILVSVLTDLMILHIQLETLPKVIAAFAAGGLVGVGLLVVFREGSSLGGINILALWLEDKFHIHTGKSLMWFDIALLLLAAVTITLEQIGYSLLCFVVMSSVLRRYHKMNHTSAKNVKQPMGDQA
ncbi:YitT family protein [Oceanospirillum sanctuarii]|uniref:YitT family protein n=1 Tax=Oceanospirillum sanctuarii TaxID=1434821 RepID=UPI000A35E6CC|nr:YitT family protein [Oceanospirillum sanctuarii]